MTSEEVVRRWPRLTAHVIAESLGYATPSCAGRIIADAKEGRQNWCEWVATCFAGDAREVIRRSIVNRHTHKGYMASYSLALEIVREAIKKGTEPLFASWF